jgi:hypothetical protein
MVEDAMTFIIWSFHHHLVLWNYWYKIKKDKKGEAYSTHAKCFQNVNGVAQS